MQKGNSGRMRAEHLLDRTIANYRLLEILGRGGMSTVFLAQQLEPPRSRAAIKILVPSDFSTLGEFATFQARFQREAQAVHQLQHEHILPVLDYGEEDGLFYMAMPMISGGTLAQRLNAAEGLLPLDEVNSYLSQLTSAVDYAHQHGMVHRDIKPSNVLTDEQGKVYLADFGIVRLFDSGNRAFDEALPTLTTTGKIYGTPAYMAPERYKGEPAEPATDIYALGVLLYQLVTGQVPFDADNPLALGMKHLNEEPVRPRTLRPDLPEPAEGAILKAVAKRPAERFGTASALALAFDTGLAGAWTPELQLFAASQAAAEENQQALISLPDDIQLADMPTSIDDHHALAFASTAVNAPVVARATPHFWRNLQIVALAMLGVVILLFATLLVLAALKLVPPVVPSPGMQVLPTSTSSLPTRTGITPVSSGGVTPASGSNTPAPGTTPTSRPTVGSTPTPAATPTPVPTSSLPTPTPAPSPTPAADGTP